MYLPCDIAGSQDFVLFRLRNIASPRRTAGRHHLPGPPFGSLDGRCTGAAHDPDEIVQGADWREDFAADSLRPNPGGRAGMTPDEISSRHRSARPATFSSHTRIPDVLFGCSVLIDR